MLAYNSIMEAVKGLLGEKFPGVTIYTDRTPKNFDRPSFLVTLGPFAPDPDDPVLPEVTVDITITIFTPVDGYQNASSEEMMTAIAAVQRPFIRGEFMAMDADGPRYPHVAAITGDYQADFAEVKITVKYRDDWGVEDGARWPLMESVDVEIKTN